MWKSLFFIYLLNFESPRENPHFFTGASHVDEVGRFQMRLFSANSCQTRYQTPSEEKKINKLKSQDHLRSRWSVEFISTPSLTKGLIGAIMDVLRETLIV